MSSILLGLLVLSQVADARPRGTHPGRPGPARPATSGSGQAADASYSAPEFDPTYTVSTAPVVAVDTTHTNFHTIDGRYEAFATLLEADGVIVESFSAPYTVGCIDDLEHCSYWQRLLDVDTLVIANAESTISAEEAEVIAGWVSGELGCEEDQVCEGRSLLLIADHQSRGFDFPMHISELSGELGLNWPNNNVAQRTFTTEGPYDSHSGGQLNKDHPIIQGRGPEEVIESVETFYGSGLRIPEGYGSSLLTLPENAIYIDAFSASHSAEGYTQGLAFQWGLGRVYCSGEAAMFTAQVSRTGAEFGMSATPDNEQYLLNIMHWFDGLLDEDDQDHDGILDVEDNCVSHANPDQFDADLDGYGNRCDADFNNDGGIGMDDLAQVLAALNTVDDVLDIDQDGWVGLTDMLRTHHDLGKRPGPSGLDCAGTTPCFMDNDGDGIPNTLDNCLDLANPLQVDADLDGYGNLCDADFNNDGGVGMDDLASVLAALNTVNNVLDMDQDGLVGLSDMVRVQNALGRVPGASGLACAGTVPCKSTSATTSK